MELPPALRMAVDRALRGAAINDIAEASAALSQRYRGERYDGRLHVATTKDALAYLAARLPATYAAVRNVFAAAAEACPDFSPRTMLDAGAGPGTVLWAAADCWSALAGATMLEASPVFAALGQELAASAGLRDRTWRVADIARTDIDDTPRDLVTAAYVLNELRPAVRPRVIDQLWRATAQMLVIVEPGTPVGWQHILEARNQLIVAGGHVVAPCPHDFACPLQSPDWCHFVQRVSRSRLHRQAKDADVPWEDEKFGYVVVSRKPLVNAGQRVIARPRRASGHVTLKLCRPDGTASNEVFSRREGERFKRARRCDWGSSL